MKSPITANLLKKIENGNKGYLGTESRPAWTKGVQEQLAKKLAHIAVADFEKASRDFDESRIHSSWQRYQSAQMLRVYLNKGKASLSVGSNNDEVKQTEEALHALHSGKFNNRSQDYFMSFPKNPQLLEGIQKTFGQIQENIRLLPCGETLRKKVENQTSPFTEEELDDVSRLGLEIRELIQEVRQIPASESQERRNAFPELKQKCEALSKLAGIDAEDPMTNIIPSMSLKNYVTDNELRKTAARVRNVLVGKGLNNVTLRLDLQGRGFHTRIERGGALFQETGLFSREERGQLHNAYKNMWDFAQFRGVLDPSSIFSDDAKAYASQASEFAIIGQSDKDTGVKAIRLNMETTAGIDFIESVAQNDQFFTRYFDF